MKALNINRAHRSVCVLGAMRVPSSIPTTGQCLRGAVRRDAAAVRAWLEGGAAYAVIAAMCTVAMMASIMLHAVYQHPAFRVLALLAGAVALGACLESELPKAERLWRELKQRKGGEA